MDIVAFVVLHYENTEDTNNCLKSLLKYITDNVYVVVVDNGSTKGKLDNIENDYKLYNNIVFLRNNTNLGFAKGNNVGFNYAKEILKSNFIILTNSDTVFEQEDFVKKILMNHVFTKFDVAGPKIISLVDGKNQNPVQVMYNGLGDLQKRIFKYHVLLVASYFNLDLLIKKYFSKEIQEIEISDQQEIQLHGACMIFGPKYIKLYEGLYAKTFMYGEESILKFIVQRDGLKMLYLEDIMIYHKEGSSTDTVYGKGKEKRQFYYKWNIDSCKILRELMNGKDDK